MKLKSWVETVLFIWTGIDIFLITLALYMQRIFELGL